MVRNYKSKKVDRMVTKQVEFINKTGLHARPASDFVMLAKKFESKITICKEGGEPVNE